MKKFIYFLIIIFYFLLTKNCFSLDYNDDIEKYTTEKIILEEENIKAKLLYNYVNKLEDQLKDIKDKYQIKNDMQLESYLKKLWKMSYALKLIQTKSIKNSYSEEIIKSILIDLKLLNENIKSLIKNKIYIFEKNLKKTKDKYTVIANSLWKSLDSLLINIIIPFKEKSNLSEKEKSIVKVVNSLKIESNNLKKFAEKSYSNEEEIKKWLLEILINIKKYIKEIKNIYTNN